MEQTGIVINKDGKYIDIVAMRESACGSDCSTCPAKCSESKACTVRALNSVNAQVGDRVSLEMNTKAVLSYICLVYGLPLLFFMVGVAVSSMFLKNYNSEKYQLYSLIIGIILMSIAFIIIKRIDKRSEKKQNNLIVKKIIK